MEQIQSFKKNGAVHQTSVTNKEFLTMEEIMPWDHKKKCGLHL